MRGQRELFDPIRLMIGRLNIRARVSYCLVLERARALQTRGRFAGVARMSNVRTMFEYALDKKSIPALVKAGALRWEGDDLLVVGWDGSLDGKAEAFRRRQSVLGRKGNAARWGAKVSDRVPDRVRHSKPAKSQDNADRQGYRPLEDLRSGSDLSGSVPPNESSSGARDLRPREARPAPVGNHSPPPPAAREAGRRDRGAGSAPPAPSPRGSSKATRPPVPPIPAADSWGSRAAPRVPEGGYRAWIQDLEAQREHVDRVVGRILERHARMELP